VDKCLYGGETIYATNVAISYLQETEIRLASNKRQLCCFDPNCNESVIFKRGEKRSAHFAHLVINDKCDYVLYDRKTPERIKCIKRTLYTHFNNLKENILMADMDVKLLNRHFTPLILTLFDGKQLAIEIGSKATTAKILESLSAQYKSKGIEIVWIIADEAENYISEQDAYYIKRFQLNTSEDHIAITINDKATKFTIHFLDQDKYLYKGISIHNNYNLFEITNSLKDLVVIQGKLSSFEFSEKLAEWKEQKRKKLQDYTKQKEDEERTHKEIIDYQLQKILENENQTKVSAPLTINVGVSRHVIPHQPEEPFYLKNITIPRTQQPLINKFYIPWTEQVFSKQLKKAVTDDETSIKTLISKIYECDESELQVFLDLFRRARSSEKTPTIEKYLEIFEHVLKQARRE
jgi:competence CoiA-like predicted nuclease